MKLVSILSLVKLISVKCQDANVGQSNEMVISLSRDPNDFIVYVTQLGLVLNEASRTSILRPRLNLDFEDFWFYNQWSDVYVNFVRMKK